MPDRIFLEEIKEEYEILYNEIFGYVIKEGRNDNNDQRLLSLKEKANKFARKIEQLSDTELNEKPLTLNEYIALSEIALQWQSFYASAFNSPIQINMASNSNIIGMSTTCDYLDDNEIHDRLTTLASASGMARVYYFRRWSTNEEMNSDWRIAEGMFASLVINGVINFVKRISKISYPRLEKEWFRDIKCLHGYFTWESKWLERITWNQENEKGDYLEACKHYQNMMVNENIKASCVDFELPMEYISRKYLTKDGRLDKNNTNVKRMNNEKAYHIGDQIRLYSDKENWLLAEKFMEMYYENIIPAVMEKNKLVKRKKTCNVLESFKYRKDLENTLDIVNCFEIILAIYFLDAEIIKEIWKKDPSLEICP